MNVKVIAIDINDVIRDNINQFINQYKRTVNEFCDIKYEDVTSFDFKEIFNFPTEEEFLSFKYIDYPYELFANAGIIDNQLSMRLNDWVLTTLPESGFLYGPDVMFFSPFEHALTIQSTYKFLSNIKTRVREMYFPKDSMTIYDRSDVVITANPNLIMNVPEGKNVIKIETPYNKNIDTKYSFKSLMDLINDEKDTVLKILKNETDEEKDSTEKE